MGVSGVTSTLFKRKIQDFWKDPKKAPLPTFAQLLPMLSIQLPVNKGRRQDHPQDSTLRSGTGLLCSWRLEGGGTSQRLPFSSPVLPQLVFRG